MLGSNVILMPNCVISGATRIGDNVVVSAGVTVINQVVPSNTLVFGGSSNGELTYHPLKSNPYIEYFLSA